MRRLSLTLFAILGLCYLALHLILGSSPVQKRVVSELQAVLSDYGLELEMESLEFSAFAPKVYINRVRLSTTPKAAFTLAEPLSVDKIRVRFRPLALLFGQIAIDEITLVHPRIRVPRADRLYAAAKQLFSSQESIQVQRPTYNVVFHRFGVVDALLNIESADPPFAVRSRSVTAVVKKGSGEQRSLSVQTDNLEVVWDKMSAALTKVDLDLDLGRDSLRVNRGVVQNSQVALNIMGVSRLPEKGQSLPSNFNASYEIRADLAFLEQFPTLKLPGLEGEVSSTGTLSGEKGRHSGKGSVRYGGVAFDGYEIGSGQLAFVLDEERVNISEVVLRYAGGEFRTPRMSVVLAQGYPVQGDFAFKGLLLEGVLRAVGVSDPMVGMEAAGNLNVSGSFSPFELTAKMDCTTRDLVVVDDPALPAQGENRMIEFGDGTLAGELKFTLDKMDFDAKLGLLGGELKGNGTVGFDDVYRVQATGEGLSLTRLARIAELELGGTASLVAQLKVDGNDGHVSASFDVSDAKVADLKLGVVSGDVFYQADLLTFENLLLPSVDPIRGNGFVDFKGDHTRYKFYVNARRAETDQVFDILSNLDLTFEKPVKGEVAVRVTVEGGEDGAGVSVAADGQLKNFRWFEERWLSGAFSLGYADSAVELSKLMLTKPSGALEARGRFTKKNARLQLSTLGLDISSFERFAAAPLSGQIAGSLVFEGESGHLFHAGQGDIKLIKTKFRGIPIPDSFVQLRSEGHRLEYLFNLGTDRLRGRFLRSDSGKEDELLLYFNDYDFAPLLTLALGRDIPPMADLKATGDLVAAGNFEDIASLRGSGTVSQLLVGFKSTPMSLEQPIQITMDKKGARVGAFLLQGEDSQLGIGLEYEPGKRIDARLDGRIDLQFLQPFIPGIDYGMGKVSLGLRLSGHPARYQLFGNTSLEAGAFRLTGLSDEFRAVEARLSVSQERINVDRFDALVNGGPLSLQGDVRIDRFQSVIPNLAIRADKIVLRLDDYLNGKLSGNFALRGKEKPYLLSGQCDIHEANLTRFQSGGSGATLVAGMVPVLAFDLQCLAPEKLFVATDIMQSEFRGNLHLVGNTIHPGLLGEVEAIRGSVLFRDTRFALDAATVRFESNREILPRFRVAGRAIVREVRASTSAQQIEGVQDVQEYEIGLQVSGVPSDYKIRLTSNPPLLEGEIISLLVLGVTSRGGEGGNFLDLGGALVGQIPIQSKIKNELGVNIRLSSQPQVNMEQGAGLSSATSSTDITAPTVQIQKDLTESTRLSFSNTLGTVPLKEFRIEQMLDENITVNATSMDRARGTQAQPTQAYGLDFRYRFQFE